MSHAKLFTARLTQKNREYLDELAARYGVRSAAAAMNKLLYEHRRVNESLKIVLGEKKQSAIAGQQKS